LSSKKYDVISIDPAPPIWSAGTVNLYSREFFQLCKSRLTPDGVLCLWFPENGAPGAICYDESLAVIRTFGDVFEHTTLWNGPHHWGFYLLGSMRDVPPEEFRSREVKALAEPFIQADLREFDTTCDTVEKLDALRWLDAAGARDLSAGAALITDNDPFTEFYFWRQVRKKFAAPAPTGP
jgi:spermidine synthase